MAPAIRGSQARTIVAVCLVLGAALLVLPGSRGRPSQCTTTAQAVQLEESLAGRVRCNDDALLLGTAVPCDAPPPPACAGTLVRDTVTLAYGVALREPVAVDRSALAGPLACQQQLGRAAASYVPERLRHRIAGLSRQQADALARAEVDAIASACNVESGSDAASGIVLPDVGFQCGAAVGPPGTRVDAAALRRCVHDLFEVWAERIGPDPRPLRPNILVIMTDDQRWDTLDRTQSPGGPEVMPATMAQIARRGVRFVNAFVPSPHCSPSRASFLTGQYAHRHGVERQLLDEDDEILRYDSSTIATWLDAAGYRTGLFGKYQTAWGSLVWRAERSIPPGWDHWCVFEETGLYYSYSLIENGLEIPFGVAPTDYATDVLRDKALGFLDDAAARGDPFFLVYAPVAPHLPIVPADRHLTDFAELPPFRPPSFNEPDVSDKPEYVRTRRALSEPVIDAFRVGQLRMLQAVDEAVAALMQRMRELGLERDTLVIYTSDNGLFWAEHRLTGKNLAYEEAIRVPLVVRYPRLAPLPRSDVRLVLDIDLASTLAELAGAIPERQQDGRSLVPVLDGTATGWRQDFLAEGWPTHPAWAAVREKDWKYVEYATGEAELYDLTSDPFELRNRFSDPQLADRAARMARRLRQLRPRWPDDVAP